METIKVYWKGKFNGKAVAINAADFNPKFHRNEFDGAWPAEKAEVKPVAKLDVKAEGKPDAK
jgi:hypothetical protein